MKYIFTVPFVDVHPTINADFQCTGTPTKFATGANNGPEGQPLLYAQIIKKFPVNSFGNTRYLIHVYGKTNLGFTWVYAEDITKAPKKQVTKNKLAA